MTEVSNDYFFSFFECVTIRILNLTISEMQLVAKERNIDGYQNMNVKQLKIDMREP